MIQHEQGNGSGGGQPLLRPRLGDLRLPNRVVMAPLTRARAAGGDLAPTGLHAAYYAQRATAGLIITEGPGSASGRSASPACPGSTASRRSPPGSRSPAWYTRSAAASSHSCGTRAPTHIPITSAARGPPGPRPSTRARCPPPGPAAGNRHPPRDDAGGYRHRALRLRSRRRAGTPGRLRWGGDRRQRHVPDPPVPQPAAEPEDRRVRRGRPPAGARDRGRRGGRLGGAAGRCPAVTVLVGRGPLPASPRRGRYPYRADAETLAGYDALVAALSGLPGPTSICAAAPRGRRAPSPTSGRSPGTAGCSAAR